MKCLTISFLLCFLLPFLSCSKENSKEIVLRINHHEAVTNCFLNDLVFLVQREGEFDTDVWSTFCSSIEGFEYELGYVYELNVLQIDIENPPQDSSSLRYELINVISKEKAPEATEFEILLRNSFGDTTEAFLTGNAEEGFSILNQLDITCNENCGPLEEVLNDDKLTRVYGIFKHTGLKNFAEFVALKEE